MNEMSGFIKLHRSFKNWEWYHSIPTKIIYLHLLLCANYKPDTWHGQALAAGQLITSRKSLCTATGLSEQQVRTALKHLESTGYITIRATNNFSVITVCGWEVYQNEGANSTYRATNRETDIEPADEPQLKNIKNSITEDCIKNLSVATEPAIEPPSAPTPKQEDLPFYQADGSVDMDKLRAYITEPLQKKA